MKKNKERKRKRTVFDRSAFSPCNCDFDKVQSPIWDLKATSSEQNPVNQTITHYNVRLKIFGLPKSVHPVLALRNPKGENKINDDEKLRVGVSVGSGIGGLETIYEGSLTINQNTKK